MTYGFIFCAGNETRFDGDKPKSLSVINCECLLDNNIILLSNYCNKVFVVCSNTNNHHFDGYDKIVIDSGKGCGDAVLKALGQFVFLPYDRCIILWGDCILQESVIKQMMLNSDIKNHVTIPCHYEEKPYVRLTYSNQDCSTIKVEFGKYNEVCGPGFHDYGLFLSYANYLKYHLNLFCLEIIDENGDYKHKHGNEMQFLDVFNETEIQAKLIEIQDVKPLSFNTKEELYELKL